MASNSDDDGTFAEFTNRLHQRIYSIDKIKMHILSKTRQVSVVWIHICLARQDRMLEASRTVTPLDIMAWSEFGFNLSSVEKARLLKSTACSLGRRLRAASMIARHRTAISVTHADYQHTFTDIIV